MVASQVTQRMNTHTLSSAREPPYKESQYKANGMLVDTGATYRIVTKDVLKRVYDNFNTAKYYMELADGHVEIIWR